MSKNPIIVGLDIGTSLTKIAVGKRLREDKQPSIIALGVAQTEGIRKGMVVDMNDTSRSIHLALESASKMIEEDIRQVTVALNGPHIQAFESTGKVAVSRADGEVTEEDVTRVFNNANPGPSGQNKHIIEVIPKTFILDEEGGIKNPVGMNGIRLELEALILEGNVSPLRNLEKCIQNQGLNIEHQELGIIAASRAVLTKKQKDLGVALIDMGAGTTSLAVYEEGKLIHLAILPIGAAHITNDIAIGMRTSIEVAEKVKLKYGYALESELAADAKVRIDLAKFNSEEIGVFPISYVACIVEARLKELFSLVNQELKTIRRDGLLPAGVILVGGGANLRAITELAKQELKLPVKIGIPQGVEGSIADVDSPIYASLVGLILGGFESPEETKSYEYNSQPSLPKGSTKLLNPLQKIIKLIIPD